ncbi:MAG: PEPxxWA-CTERM sorting domain-containing protein [Sphingomonadaceae bacterium]
MLRSFRDGLATAVLAMAPLATTASAEVILFDVAGILSIDTLGSPLNEVRLLDIGPFTEVIGFGWNVLLVANPGSVLFDMMMTASDSSGSNGFVFSPSNDLVTGAKTYSSNGIQDLISLGLNFQVGADGLLRLEFHELVSDLPGAPDGEWREGQLAFQIRPGTAPVIPEPGTWAMMIAGFGLVGLAARSRRRSTLPA